MSIIRLHDVYLASFIKEDVDADDNPIRFYAKPISFKTTLNSLNGSSEIAVYGDRIKNVCKTVLNYDEWIGKIKERDVAYLYGATPDGETVNGEKANYYVDAVLPQNKKILVYLEKIV